MTEQQRQIATIKAQTKELDRYRDLVEQVKRDWPFASFKDFTIWFRNLQAQQAKVMSAYELSPLPKPETRQEAEKIMPPLVDLAESLREVRTANRQIRSNFPGQARLKQVARDKGGYRYIGEKFHIKWEPYLRRRTPAVVPTANVIPISAARSEEKLRLTRKRVRNASSIGRPHL